MGERVHTRGRGQHRRQAARQLRVEHSVIRDEREIVDRVFVMRGGIGDDGGEGRLAARSGGGRRGDEQRRAPEDAQQAAHALHRLARLGDACADDFRAIHHRAAADRDDRLRMRGKVERAPFLDVRDGGVRHGLVVDGAGDGGRFQRVFQPARQAERADGSVRHQQDGGNLLFRQQRNDGGEPVELHRLAIGQDGERRAEDRLIGAAEEGVGFIHGKLLWRRFQRRIAGSA